MKPRTWLLDGVLHGLPADEKALVFDTLNALAAADLDAVVTALVDRVLGPIDEDSNREERLVDHANHLQPYAELLLRDLWWVAAVPGWTLSTRRDHALDMIAFAGF